MKRRFRRSEACTTVSEGGLEPPTRQRVDLRKRGSEHETAPRPTRFGRLQTPSNGSVVDGVNTSRVFRTVVKLAVIVGFVVTFYLVYPAFEGTSQAAPAPREVATCSAACHAQGIAVMQARINAQVKTLEQGRHCWPATSNRLTANVIARGAYLATGQVSLISFDRAWALNHNATAGDDVWVLARCS